MPIVIIDGLVSFAANRGVQVHEKALTASPEELARAVRAAFSHMDDPPLVDACCGGRGPLANYASLEYREYLALLRQIEIAEAGTLAKKEHTRRRRAEFDSRRSHLVLAMLDRGVPYVCAIADCGVSRELTVDHIKALSRGGTDEPENLRFLCRAHNSSKGDSEQM